jgi:hypothetical protein
MWQGAAVHLFVRLVYKDSIDMLVWQEESSRALVSFLLLVTHADRASPTCWVRTEEAAAVQCMFATEQPYARQPPATCSIHAASVCICEPLCDTMSQHGTELLAASFIGYNTRPAVSE